MCTWGVALFFKFILKTSILYSQSQSITSYRELRVRSITQKPPNVGSSIAISEPIIAGLVLAGSPNSMKLGNLVQ